MNIIFKTLRHLIKKRKIIKNLIIVILLVTTILLSILAANYKNSYEKSSLRNDSLISSDLELKNKNEELGYILNEKEAQIKQLETKLMEVQDTANKLALAQKGNFKADGNYDQAQIVWNSLKNLGLNDYVCAGIMGNIMREVGGDTLDISRWPVYSQTVYYGVCQWAGSRKERLLRDFGTTLNDQIRFLSVELFEVIPQDNSFYQMTDEREAALYFAKKYERCSSKGYEKRQRNATKALEYFTQ